jgi:hypothetical protein
LNREVITGIVTIMLSMKIQMTPPEASHGVVTRQRGRDQGDVQVIPTTGKFRVLLDMA